MRIFCKYNICNKSATIWHHVQIHKKATSLQHIGNRWLRGICSPATGAKIYAKIFICLYAKMAKMSDFSNHNIFAYMLASCANLNFHPVVTIMLPFHDYMLYICMQHVTTCYHYFLKNNTYISFFKIDGNMMVT